MSGESVCDEIVAYQLLQTERVPWVWLHSRSAVANSIPREHRVEQRHGLVPRDRLELQPRQQGILPQRGDRFARPHREHQGGEAAAGDLVHHESGPLIEQLRVVDTQRGRGARNLGQSARQRRQEVPGIRSTDAEPVDPGR